MLMPAPAGATYDFNTVANGAIGSSLAWTVDHGTDFGTLAAPAPLAQGSPAGATYQWYVMGHGLTDADAALSRSLVHYYDLLFLGSGGPAASTRTASSR